MAELILAETNTVTTPSVGNISFYACNTANPILRFKNDAGTDRAISGITNYSVTSQSVGAASRTYITGSALAIPVNKVQIGSSFRWRISATKTAAGTAASTIDVCVGTAGTTADTARISFTKPAGTAVIDEGLYEIEVVVRSIGAAGVAVGQMTFVHNLASTGHATIPVVCVSTVSAGFDTTVSNLIFGVCMTTGAADAITIQLVQAEAWNI